MSRLILVTNCDDWEALYLDGKCVAQDHEISRDELVDYVLDVREKHEYVETDGEQTCCLGCFPERLEDVEGIIE